MNRRYILTLTTGVLLVLSLLLSPSPVLAGKDRTPPTQPTNLHTTAITATSVTLAWNPSTDNSGNFTYRVHMVSPSTGYVYKSDQLHLGLFVAEQHLFVLCLRHR